MKTYRQLEREFNKKVEKAQKLCPHKKSTWMESWFALGHSKGYQVKVCKRCNKVLKEKPTKEEREAERDKRMAGWLNVNRKDLKKQIGGKLKC